MSEFVLAETCCGGAALTLHLLGAKRALLPYQGSKWRLRRQLADILSRMGFDGPPARVLLTDPGPWGAVMRTVLDPTARLSLIGCLRWLAARDPRAVYERLHGHRVHQGQVKYAAEFLFLQRLAFSGKAVGGTPDGRWCSPGFNTSSAYGLAATSRFGTVNPMVPSLIRALESLNLQPAISEVWRVPAVPMARPGFAARMVVYIDPPYYGSTAYPGGVLSAASVRDLAMAWYVAGAAVMISERGPVPMGAGWAHERLGARKTNTSPFRGKHEEWVTVSPRHHANTKR